MGAAFDRAQAAYDAAEPEDADEEYPNLSAQLRRAREEEEVPPYRIDGLLEALAGSIAAEGLIEDSGDVHTLSDRQATVGIWIDGREYSLTLNRED